MEKVSAFFKKWQSAILVGLFCFIYLGQCSTNRTIDKMRKDNIVLSKRIDKLDSTFRAFKPVTNKDLMIEGLKAEKRMIQSIDRKLLDVKRQSEIDKEIQALQESK